jgi:hypothetical protein
MGRETRAGIRPQTLERIHPIAVRRTVCAKKTKKGEATIASPFLDLQTGIT